MTILARTPTMIVCGPDGYGECVIAGKTWRWEYHNYLGPTFLRKDGEPLVRQPGGGNSVWGEFEKWLKEK